MRNLFILWPRKNIILYHRLLMYYILSPFVFFSCSVKLKDRLDTLRIIRADIFETTILFSFLWKEKKSSRIVANRKSGIENWCVRVHFARGHCFEHVTRALSSVHDTHVHMYAWKSRRLYAFIIQTFAEWTSAERTVARECL